MKSERFLEGSKVPLCNDCVLFVKGMSRCKKSEWLDQTHTGYWPSDALSNRLAEHKCGLEGKYFERRETKKSFLSRLAHILMEVNVERYVFFALIFFVLVLVFGGF